MKAERLKQMEDFISKRDYVTIDELSDRFSVHKNTVRADINELAEKGILEKKYGGVSYKPNIVPTSYEERETMSIDSKRSIGRLAASLLEEDDIIYVDSGTTTAMLFADLSILPQRLTVITNSLSVISRCFRDTKYNIYVLPGKGDRKLNSFASFETIESAQAYNIQKAFMGVRGISDNGTLSSASQIDARIKSAVLDCSQQRILMAEAEKVNHPAMVNFAQLSAFDTWICNQATEETVALSKVFHLRFLTP